MIWNPEECVTRGAEYLDENHPEWWFKIDLSKLDMASCSRCIIGQAVRNYEDWQDGVLHNVAIELGFLAPESQSSGMNVLDYDRLMNQYKELDEKWTDVVKERFNQ